MLKLADSTYFDTTPSEQVTPEERAGLNPPTEEQLRRTNPKREDPRETQLTNSNEDGHDSPISNRYDNTIPLESSLKLSWKAIRVEPWVVRNNDKSVLEIWTFPGDYKRGWEATEKKRNTAYWSVFVSPVGDRYATNKLNNLTYDQAAGECATQAADFNGIYYVTPADKAMQEYIQKTNYSLKLSWLVFNPGDTVRLTGIDSAIVKKHIGFDLSVDMRVDKVNEKEGVCDIYPAFEMYGRKTITNVPFKNLILVKRHEKISPESSLIKQGWAKPVEINYDDPIKWTPEYQAKYQYFVIGSNNRFHVCEFAPDAKAAVAVTKDMSYKKARFRAQELAQEKVGVYIISAQEQIYVGNLHQETSLKLGWNARLKIIDRYNDITDNTYAIFKSTSYSSNLWNVVKWESFNRESRWKLVESQLSYDKAVQVAENFAVNTNGNYFISGQDANERDKNESDANKTASLEELDWEIDRTIEAYSMLNVVASTVKPEAFIAKLLQRHELTVPRGTMEKTADTFYRGGGPGSMPLGKTAQDVVDYERNELGNKDIVIVDPSLDLNTIPARNLEWVTKRESDAEYYGEVEKHNYPEGSYRVIARYNDEAFLIEHLDKANSKLHKFEQRAVREYGKTNVPISAAFIMSNGELIDSSGQRQGGWGEGRAIDHREIANHGIGNAKIPQAYLDKGQKGYSTGLLYYMTATGNTRISVNSDSIMVDMQNPMNKAQWNTFAALAYGKVIYADFCDNMGNKIDSGEYNNLRSFKKDYDKVYGKKVNATLHEYEDNAVDSYGRTSDVNEASFILSDGTLLHQAFDTPHSEIAYQSVNTDDIQDYGKAFYDDNALVHYMSETGGVRLALSTRKGDVIFFNSNKPMTEAQWHTFTRISYGKKIAADLCDTMGKCLYSGELPNLRAFKQKYYEVYGSKTAAMQYPKVLDRDGMIKFIELNKLRDTFGELDYNDMKQIAAAAADSWVLKDIPLDAFDWIERQQIGKTRTIPIIVIDYGDNVYEVLDGKHRIGEARARGEKTILAYVGSSTVESSLKLSWRQIPEQIFYMKDTPFIPAKETYVWIAEFNNKWIPIIRKRMSSSGSSEGEWTSFDEAKLSAYSIAVRENAIYLISEAEREYVEKQQAKSSLKIASTNEALNQKVFNDRNPAAKSGPELFWGSEEAQRRRFKFMLSKGFSLKDYEKQYVNKSILDIGCGYGDLYDYLKDAGLKSYIGIDILPKVIETAKDTHKNAVNNVKFEVRDILKDPYPDNSFDYVFGVGIFALNCDDYLKYVKNMLKTMYKACRIETAANFAFGNSSGDEGTFIAIQPDTIKELIDFTKNIDIEVDKETSEFNIFLRK
jgi:2-polyprenyl-3-methyl-5-hydroxy-6-metoxy-1,4-benzoquinol methylase